MPRPPSSNSFPNPCAPAPPRGRHHRAGSAQRDEAQTGEQFPSLLTLRRLFQGVGSPSAASVSNSQPFFALAPFPAKFFYSARRRRSASPKMHRTPARASAPSQLPAPQRPECLGMAARNLETASATQTETERGMEGTTGVGGGTPILLFLF